ncbi:hypothetical protein ABT052_28805 [Streptomyces sp. NPDC002766]|uniref:hypothetical protein n=1 Tax=Streptomyces sp. NPDC002766 TaxID=3154429 RepID=UPI0033244C26
MLAQAARGATDRWVCQQRVWVCDLLAFASGAVWAVTAADVDGWLAAARARGAGPQTDLDRGRLHLPKRTVLLAQPVQTRLSAYLTHRTTTWPRTANPHLFLTMRSAATTTPASSPWLHRHYPTSSHLLRADRIADEAQRTADTRMICELFGLSYDAATRYTRPYTDAATAAGHDLPTPPSSSAATPPTQAQADPMRPLKTRTDG